MSLVLKQNCIGLDCEIKKVQLKFWNALNPLWNNPNWQSYPRVYKNKRIDNNGKEVNIPEFSDENNEYEDTLFNDNFDAVSFFYEGEKVAASPYLMESTVSFILSCDLERLLQMPTKEDMRLRKQIFNVCQTLTKNWQLTDVKTGVDEVYREFKNKNIIQSSISNRFLIRFDFKVQWMFQC